MRSILSISTFIEPGEDAMRTFCTIVLFSSFVLLCSCNDNHPDQTSSPVNNPRPALPAGTSDPFHERLREIAREYEAYGPADRVLRWAYVYCWSPTTKMENESGQLRFSESSDSTTHGRKLFVVYARHVWDSPRSSNLVRGSYITFPLESSPVGQAIVKESWIPEEIEDPLHSPASEQSGKGPHTQVVERDGQKFRAAHKGKLFMMYKLDPATPGTDNGWVYGVVSADGKQVLSAGRIESCMKCHVDAPHDRLFGLPEEQKPPGK